MMKKMLCLLLALTTVLCFAACSTQQDSSATDAEATREMPDVPVSEDVASIADGWVIAENTTLDETRQSLFDIAIRNLGGVRYEAIAYIGTQNIPGSGVNHCFLGTIASETAHNFDPYYALIYIYEDGLGGANVQHVAQITPDMIF